jgi:hypothetical protein
MKFCLKTQRTLRNLCAFAVKSLCVNLAALCRNILFTFRAGLASLSNQSFHAARIGPWVLYILQTFHPAGMISILKPFAHFAKSLRFCGKIPLFSLCISPFLCGKKSYQLSAISFQMKFCLKTLRTLRNLRAFAVKMNSIGQL